MPYLLPDTQPGPFLALECFAELNMRQKVSSFCPIKTTEGLLQTPRCVFWCLKTRWDVSEGILRPCGEQEERAGVVL